MATKLQKFIEAGYAYKDVYDLSQKPEGRGKETEELLARAADRLVDAAAELPKYAREQQLGEKGKHGRP